MNSPLTIPVKNALSHIVVVGNGMVGQHLVEQLVQKMRIWSTELP